MAITIEDGNMHLLKDDFGILKGAHGPLNMTIEDNDNNDDDNKEEEEDVKGEKEDFDNK